MYRGASHSAIEVGQAPVPALFKRATTGERFCTFYEMCPACVIDLCSKRMSLEGEILDNARVFQFLQPFFS